MITIEDDRARRIITHLHVARINEMSSRKVSKSGRVPVATQVAIARARESREMACLAGLGSTESDVWWRLHDSAEVAGPDWKGKNGAFISSAWLGRATDAYLHLLWPEES